MSKKSQKPTYISNNSIKKFLNQNNVSLKHLGDEEKQEEYITKLCKVLVEYKKNKSNVEAGDKVKSADRIKNLHELGILLQDSKMEKEIQEKFIQTFIPFKFFTKEQKEYIKSMRDQLDDAKKEIERLKEENERLKNSKNEEVEEQTQDEMFDDDWYFDEKEPEDELILTEDEIKNKSDFEEPDIEYTPKQREYDSDYIEIDGKVIDKRDEKASDILKSMIEHQKVLKEKAKQEKANKKNAKDSLDISIKKDKTIASGVKKILGVSRDILLYYLPNGNLSHDLIAGTAFIGAATAVTGLYVTGRLAGKAVKGIGKIGIKTIKGAAKLTSLTGKAIFKGAKGAAKKCKQKADEINKARKQNKFNKTVDALATLDEVTSKVLDFSADRLNETILGNNKNNYDSNYTSLQKRYLNDIQNNEKRESIENKILHENNDLAVKLKKGLIDLSLRGISIEIQNKLGLDYAKAKTFINSVSIDENGELEIPEGSPVTLEEIEKAGIDEHLKRVVQIPKPKNFTLEDLDYISYYLEFPEKYDKNKAQKIGLNKNVIDYIENVSKEVKASQENGFITKEEISDLNGIMDCIYSNSSILQEAYDRDLYEIATELRTQSIELVQEFSGIYKSDEKEDFRRREALRKIAEAKLKELKNAGIFETIQKDDEKQVRILSEARRALSQDLAQDLEYTAHIKNEQINKKEETKDEH